MVTKSELLSQIYGLVGEFRELTRQHADKFLTATTQAAQGVEQGRADAYMRAADQLEAIAKAKGEC